ncbi:MAG: GNAT family N-acetyltransferase [Acidobacteriota bacterium]
MKGQVLLVRSAEPADRGAIALFLRHEETPLGPCNLAESEGFIAKLAGVVVGYAAVRRDSLSICWIDQFNVAAELRGLRIGRKFLGEIQRLARSAGCSVMAAAAGCPLNEFFLANGFVERNGFLQKMLVD